MKYFKYIFYRAFLWQQNVQTNAAAAANVALAYVSFLLAFYLLAIVAAAADIFDFPLFSPDGHSTVVFAVFCGLFFYFVPYLVFVRRGKYKTIILEFSKKEETRTQAKFREILIFLNFVSIFILAIIFAVMHQYISNE